jgi:hypothetical protein
MYENDGSLIRLARRAATRVLDPERKERGCRGNAKSLLCDRAPCRSFGHPIVLDHRVPPHSVRSFLCRPRDEALSCREPEACAESPSMPKPFRRRWAPVSCGALSDGPHFNRRK